MVMVIVKTIFHNVNYIQLSFGYQIIQICVSSLTVPIGGTCMYLQLLATHPLTSSVRDSNIHLSIKTIEPPESTVDAVGSVGGRHDDHMTTLLEPVL